MILKRIFFSLFKYGILKVMLTLIRRKEFFHVRFNTVFVELGFFRGGACEKKTGGDGLASVEKTEAKEQ